MAATEPTLPRSTPDIRVAPTAVRTVTCADAAAFTTALANANYGDHIVLTAGVTYQGNFVLKATPGGTLANGAFENYVTIMSSADASLPAAGTRVSASDVANMPTLVSPVASGAGAYAIATANGADHYRFVGINFTSPAVLGYGGIVNVAPVTGGLGGDFATQSNYPTYISFERCYLSANFDYGCQKGMTLDGEHIQVVDSVATNVMQLNNSDANAIVLNYGIGPYKVDNNLIEGMGENLFFGGACSGGIVVVAGEEWEVPNDVTVTNNYIRRKLEWKRDDPTYFPPCAYPAPGGSTFTSSGTTVTFSSAPGLTVPASPDTLFMKDTVTGQYRKLTALSGTTGTIASAFSPNVASGHAWTWNGDSGGARRDLQSKNLLETKACRYVLIDKNVFENGWEDGQFLTLVFNGREHGFCTDITVTNNKLAQCSGIGITVNDPNAGYGLGISPRPLSRIAVRNNLWIDMMSTATHSLNSERRANWLNSSGPANGFIYGGYSGQTITAGATTGSGVSFTSSYTLFDPSMVGNQIKYGTGAGTIVGYTDSGNGFNGSAISVNITSAFPDTSPHAANLWRIAPVALMDVLPASDSWILEHNSWVGAGDHTYFMTFLDTVSPSIPKLTNFVFRYNIALYSATPGSGYGVFGNGASDFGTAALNFYTDSTRLFQKNVFYGASVISAGYGAKLVNANGDGTGTTGAGSGFNTAFHEPDHTGSTAGGAIGFTDWTNGDYTLSGTSPYRGAVNWTGDNTDAGYVPGTLSTTWANVISGTSTPVSGVRYLPIRWP